MRRMMMLVVGLGLGLTALAGTPARADDAAKAVAQKILDAGAALFTARDAQGLAETYAENGVIALISKDQSTGQYKVEPTHGRLAIEQLYRDVFKDAKDQKARNNVESADYIGSDLLVIRGTFEPDTAEGTKYPFIQVRTRQGEQWRILTLQFFMEGQK